MKGDKKGRLYHTPIGYNFLCYQMIKPITQGQDKTYDAIYVNSFTQRVLGHDTSYVVKLYKGFTFSEISLTSAILENRFLNLYNGA